MSMNCLVYDVRIPLRIVDNKWICDSAIHLLNLKSVCSLLI